LFTDEKVPDNDISKKTELENINNKIEDREERWFELSAKIEGKIIFCLDGVLKEIRYLPQHLWQ
jgi:hypothetical protein